MGYPLKGIDVEIQNLTRRKRGEPISEARILQGEQEYLDATEEEKMEIVQRWMELVGATS